MKLRSILPPFPPAPPIPKFIRDEGEEVDQPLDEVFTSEMTSQGFDPELVKMGLKVVKNHMRPPEEAFKIGANYIREMAR